MTITDHGTDCNCWGNIQMDELKRAGRDLAAARKSSATAYKAAHTAALDALSMGVSESEVARSLGVDRMTVRKWAGKR
jgi:DNA invertase Pin-like site-specific DNA recombinase